MTRGVTPEGHMFTATYDANDRMTAIEYTDTANTVHKAEFTYDYGGFMAKLKTYENGNITADINIVRNGYLAIQERDTANTTTREYTWGLNMCGGIGGLLAMRQNNQDYNYLYDGKGNVSALIDNAQTVVAKYRYDAFGNIMAKAGTVDQPYMFSTKRYFDGVGLSYYGYRFYSAGVGRWVNRDPLGEMGGLNLYGFVGGNPVNWIDPLGLVFENIWDDPDQRERHKENAITMQEFLEYTRNKTVDDIIHELDGGTKCDSSGWGPTQRYVINPHNVNEVIDMRHFFVVGNSGGGELYGIAIEILQLISDRNSAFDSQDFLSNKLGAEFFNGWDRFKKTSLDYELWKFFYKGKY